MYKKLKKRLNIIFWCAMGVAVLDFFIATFMLKNITQTEKQSSKDMVTAALKIEFIQKRF